MPIARDHSDLPKQGGGWVPDSEPRFGPLLVEAWHAEADDDLPNAVEGARFRHSDAGACSRAIALSAAGVPASNPMDAPGHFITRQGSWLHEEFQKALVAKYGDRAQIEVKVGEGDRGGHIDAVITVPSSASPMDTWVIVDEYKSVDGFAYKMAVGERGTAQGPKYDHVIQAALNGQARNADEVVVTYGARGAISIQAAARNPKITEMMRVTAEWTLSREEYEPIADKEIERITAILKLLDDGILAARKIPDPELPASHLVTDPKTGTWVATDTEGRVTDSGTTWHCAYCRHQDTCVRLDSRRQDADVLVQIGVK